MMLQLAMDLPNEPLSVPICRRALRAVLQDLKVDELRAFEIELVLGEAAGNVIRHAYHERGNSYRVELEVSPDKVRLAVSDRGRGFDRSALRPPTDEDAGGRGLQLIEEIADVARVEAVESGGTRMTAEFSLGQPPSTTLRSGG